MLVGEWRIAEPIWHCIAAADVLRPVAPGSGIYVFKNRFLMHYVLLLASRRLARDEPQPAAHPPGVERAPSLELSQP